MAFRTIVISSHSKLEYSLDYLVFKSADQTKRIFLDEISTLIIESTDIVITTALLSELIKRKINVIFCDEKHNPLSQLISLHGSYNNFKKYKNQINWDNSRMRILRKNIVKEKIKGEIQFLTIRDKKDEALLLEDFFAKVEEGDATNREGHAAKVYFNKIFGENFSRHGDSVINVYLNYGYTLLLSLINRSLTSLGYLTELGIHHIGETNPFNLSSDFIEPFRVIVDQLALRVTDESFKEEYQQMLSINVSIDGKSQTLTNAINIYINSLLSYLNGDIEIDKVKFLDFYVI